jgi:hypothetical protein
MTTDSVLDEAASALVRVIRDGARTSTPDTFLRADLTRALTAFVELLHDRGLTLVGVAKAAQAVVEHVGIRNRIEVGMRVVHTKSRIRGRVKHIRADVEVDGLKAHVEHSYNVTNLEPEDPEAPPTIEQWRQQLLDLWHVGHNIDAGPKFAPEFAAWSGATKDLLLYLGLVPTADRMAYTFENKEH